MEPNEATDVLAGVVVDGKVVLEDDTLPNGTRVAVRVLHSEEDSDTFHVTPEEKAELLNRIASIRAGEFVDGRAHLQQLRDGG